MKQGLLIRAGIAAAAVAATAGAVNVATRGSASAEPLSQNDLTEQAIHTSKVKQAKRVATAKATRLKTISRSKRGPVSAPNTNPTAPAKSNPAPAPAVVPQGSAQEIAHQMVLDRGWSEADFQALVQLWNRESGWNPSAANGSGAYGIPQALPGSKMASAGADWETNPVTQITWGLGYIAERYGTPSNAWAHSQANGWY